jgi:hypothetical protein
MSNPESYARIPITVLKEKLDFIELHIKNCLRVEVIESFIKRHKSDIDDYDRFYWFFKLFATVPESNFMDYLHATKKDYQEKRKYDNFTCYSTPYYKCAFPDDYHGVRKSLKRMVDNLSLIHI